MNTFRTHGSRLLVLAAAAINCNISNRRILKLFGISKRAETFIKGKRLKQLINEGKSYEEYIDEQRRCIGSSNNFSVNSFDSGTSEGSGNVESRFMDAYQKAVRAGLIDKSSDPLEVRGRVFRYQQTMLNADKRYLRKDNDEMISDNSKRADITIKTANFSVVGCRNHTSESSVNDTYQVAFLSDSGVVEEKRFFYRGLFAFFKATSPYVNEESRNQTKGVAVNVLPMPNIYELNTKRYEIDWMNYMRSLGLDKFDLVVGHGTSAEALLRYVESEKVKKVMLIDSSDIYTAGERHGRAYQYSLIAGNCKSVRILSTSDRADLEAATLSVHLKNKIVKKSVSLTQHCCDERRDVVCNVIFNLLLEELGVD